LTLLSSRVAPLVARNPCPSPWRKRVVRCFSYPISFKSVRIAFACARLFLSFDRLPSPLILAHAFSDSDPLRSVQVREVLWCLGGGVFFFFLCCFFECFFLQSPPLRDSGELIYFPRRRRFFPYPLIEFYPSSVGPRIYDSIVYLPLADGPFLYVSSFWPPIGLLFLLRALGTSSVAFLSTTSGKCMFILFFPAR